MSKPFTDLDLTDEQIASNYTWKQIKNNQEYTDSKILDDLDRNLLVVSNRDNSVDDAVESTDNVVVGTNIELTETGTSVCVGHHFVVDDSSDVIKIGGGQNEVNDDIISSQEVINIGYNNSCSNTGALVSIGHDNDTQGGVRNVIIGNANGTINCTDNIHIGNSLSLAGYNGLSNTVIIAPNLIPGIDPVSGSIIFGGGVNNSASDDARIQFLSNNLVDAGVAFTEPLSGGGESAYDGYIPIKYKGTKYRIPVLLDP